MEHTNHTDKGSCEKTISRMRAKFMESEFLTMSEKELNEFFTKLYRLSSPQREQTFVAFCLKGEKSHRYDH